jgi:predicted GH43/DUF377 family glycosyl hydrolase
MRFPPFTTRVVAKKKHEVIPRVFVFNPGAIKQNERLCIVFSVVCEALLANYRKVETLSE